MVFIPLSGFLSVLFQIFINTIPSCFIDYCRDFCFVFPAIPFSYPFINLIDKNQVYYIPSPLDICFSEKCLLVRVFISSFKLACVIIKLCRDTFFVKLFCNSINTYSITRHFKNSSYNLCLFFMDL